MSKLGVVDSAQLQSDLAQVWNSGINWGIVPEDTWPASVRNLGPKQLRIEDEGVFLQVWSLMAEEDGLFVLPPNSDFEPAANGDPSFRRLSDGLYYYKVSG